MRKPVAAVVATTLLGALTAGPSLAQYSRTSKGGNVVQTNGREQVKPYMSRPQIEILDESPIVKDRRSVQQDPTYEIVVPPLPGRGGGGQGPAGGGGANVIRVTPSAPGGSILAKPGFESNMRSLPTPARPLPMADKIGVHAKVDAPGRAGPALPMRGTPSPGGPVVHAGGSPGTAVYKDTPVIGGSSQGTRQTSIDVNAVRLPPKRGDLIHHQ